MADPKVAPEVALEDFNRMCDSRRINRDGKDWTNEETEWFAKTRKLICDLISSGEVTIDAAGDPTFKFGVPPIKLGKVTGAALLAMDGKIENARIFSALAAISGMGITHFSAFDVQDIHILKMFYVLFFQR